MEAQEVSFKSREKKRRAKIAVAQVKRQHGATMRTRYYLTKVKKDCRCRGCGAALRKGADLVYRHDGQVTLCVPCADRDPLVEYRTSLRWEREAQRKLEKRRGSQRIGEPGE
jgi:RNase P subunit RPR2